MKHINPRYAVRHGLAAIAAIVALAVPAGMAAAAPASAATHTPAITQVVLLNAPPQRVTLGHTFPVGAWYQQFSGGRRYYTVAVYGPFGHRIFYHAGWASPVSWQIWQIRASRLGYYKTVYHYWYAGVWRQAVFYTHSIR